MVKELRATKPRSSFDIVSAVYNLGQVWNKLHAAMVERAEFTSVAWWRIAGIMAALSPNNSQKQNLRAVDTMVRGHDGGLNRPQLLTLRIPCYPRDREKAVRILYAGNTGDVERILRGQKTISFYRNILDPDNRDREVTIDGHMLNMMRVGYRADQKPPRLQAVGTMTGTQYKAAQAVVRNAADVLRVPPSHLQSVVWLTWKRLYNLAHDAQERLWL